MSSYTSLNSYLLAIKLRSAKTILVEGSSDKKVLSRIFLEHHISEQTKPQFLIDDASIINDNTHMPSFGNRQKVITIGTNNTEHTKLTFLADREWDGWAFTPEPLENQQANNINGFYTRGHSIENYWFVEDALTEYLKHMHADVLRAEYFTELSIRFKKFIEFSAAYSLTAKNARIINKCNNLLKHAHLSWSGSEYQLNNSILTCLQARQANIDITTDFQDNYNLIRETAIDTLKWLSHGHLGEEALRCCAAHLALEYGTSPAVVEEIERGDRANKLHFDATYISQLPVDAIDPIDKIITWLKN